jgi:hypothetical protein
MTIETSILDYMGKIEQSIFVLVSFVYNNKYYEGIFVYTDEQIMLNVDDDLEEVLGCTIKQYKEYEDILRFLIKNVVPWSEMINRIDDIDLSAYEPITSATVVLAQDIDNDQITSSTQS